MTTVSPNTADERRQLRDHFRTVLLDAASQRSKRPASIHAEFGPEWEWMRYERVVMLTAVNDERYRRDLPPATADQIQAVNIQAVNIQAGGHSDYADKFALYCAEIAMGIERTVY